MRVLAVHEDSNANLAVVSEHGVEFAVAEERLSRTRFQGGFPRRSLAELTARTGLTIDDMDAVVVANRYHAYSRLPGVELPTFEHPFLGVSQKGMLVFQDQLFRGGAVARLTERLARGLANHRMGRAVPIVEHHTAHAYSAYVPSGFAECTAVTVDNFGDGYASSVFACRNGRVERLYGSSALHSPGQFYGEVAQVLGFHPLLAGKVTALAAFGDAATAYGVVEPLLGLSADEKDFVLPPLAEKRRNGRLYRALDTHRREDVAAAAQRRLEDVLVPYVLRAVRETGLDRVVVAGGVFGNVAVNRRLVERPEIGELYVQPAMTDQGIALGAALAVLSEGGGPLADFHLDHVFLGPGYAEREIEDALGAAGAAYTRMDDPSESIAELLAQGAVVARFDGRLELGPRALGNRSILVAATDAGLPERLNVALHRASFMPFAPATLEDEAERLYPGLAKVRSTARFMTVALPCADELRRSCPAVVHHDGSARPQVVGARDNPGFYAILSAYRARTGVGTLLNTSFNLHEEPIVCTPADALRAFATSGVDHLALGPFLVARAR